MEQWSYDVNDALEQMIQRQEMMADKLEDLELRSRRNNMRIFGVPEGTESQSGSVAKFVDTWLREELGLCRCA